MALCLEKCCTLEKCWYQHQCYVNRTAYFTLCYVTVRTNPGTVDFSSLRICVTMSVRACVSGACRACVARITLCIISRRALIHSITHARHALVLTHAHGHANSKRAEINCIGLTPDLPLTQRSGHAQLVCTVD